MMRRLRLLASLILVFCLVFCLSANVAGESYKYNVTVSGGLHGTVSGNTSYQANYGDEWNANDYTVTVDDDKYYFKGFHVSGTETLVGSMTITEDVTLVASYGVLGSQVAYVVKYVSTDGKTLASSKTFYGNAGDKPVVAYRYIEGYQPQAYNQTFTLVEGETKTIKFIYSKIVIPTAAPVANNRTNTTQPSPSPSPSTSPSPDEGQQVGSEQQTQSNQTTEQTQSDQTTQSQEIIDLDEQQPPPSNQDAAPDINTIEGQHKTALRNLATAIAAGAAGAVGLVALGVFLVKRSKKEK